LKAIKFGTFGDNKPEDGYDSYSQCYQKTEAKLSMLRSKLLDSKDLNPDAVKKVMDEVDRTWREDELRYLEELSKTK
jgi:hypothetical protein